MSKYQYGVMFEKLGVPGMGRQGSGWCNLAPNGVLVLMTHQAFYQRRDGKLFYDTPDNVRLSDVSVSAARSIRMIGDYFEPGRQILLPVGVFEFDGRVNPNGTQEPAKFLYATGDVFRAAMRQFDTCTGHLLCEVAEKFTV